jgi:protein FRA10AC1
MNTELLTGEEAIETYLSTRTDDQIHSDDDSNVLSEDKPQPKRKIVNRNTKRQRVAGPNAREHELNYIQNYLHFYGDKEAIETELKNAQIEKRKNFKTDRQMLQEQHQFLREDEDEDETDDIETAHGLKLAKEYESKLYREYCVANLSKYKEGLIGLRWRTEKEVKTERGVDTCGSLTCKRGDKRASQNEISLTTLEVNFAYVEQGEQKNALVKIRLCKKCEKRMNKANKKRKRIEKEKKSKRIKV